VLAFAFQGRQWVGRTSTRLLVRASTQPHAVRRQGNTSAWVSTLLMTACSRSRS
jgi:hypothetical protein